MLGQHYLIVRWTPLAPKLLPWHLLRQPRPMAALGGGRKRSTKMDFGCVVAVGQGRPSMSRGREGEGGGGQCFC